MVRPDFENDAISITLVLLDISTLIWQIFKSWLFNRADTKLSITTLPILAPSSIASQLLGTLILTIVSATIAIITFCLVEHPFLRLRTRLLEPHAEN